MKKLYAEGRGNPGVRRMRAGLAALGHRLSHKRVWRLMKAAGLRGRHPKAWRAHHYRWRQAGPGARPDRRAFLPTGRTRSGAAILRTSRRGTAGLIVATVIDLHSRKLVGWAIADHMRTELVTAALDMAIASRKPPAGVIFHSDRGAQYTSGDFDRYCKRNNIRRSLGRTGICYDNAVGESTFATYKKELIHTRPWPTMADPEEGDRRLDRELLQHKATPLHARVFDTQGI